MFSCPKLVVFRLSGKPTLMCKNQFNTNEVFDAHFDGILWQSEITQWNNVIHAFFIDQLILRNLFWIW